MNQGLNPFFEYAHIDEAAAFHDAHGFVAFHDVLSSPEIGTLRATIDRAIETCQLQVGDGEISNNNDLVYVDPLIKKLCCHPRIVAIVRRLIGHPIELQHAKFNAKPINDHGGGAVQWHQDYPFYPHTNYDLVSCVIHLDDEDLNAGPLCFIPGSHKWGPLSHLAPDGNFAYECTGRTDLDSLPSIVLTGPAGYLSFHHCLTLHKSAPNRRAMHRRLIVFQYRAIDAVQIAGVVWRCNGMQVEALPPVAQTARFPNGTTIELRGIGGRLIDVGGKLVPDRPAP